MKPKWQEPLEQTLHFLLGMVLPAVSARREWRQWGPGEPIHIIGKLWYPEDRVRDMLQDCSFALYGAQASIAVLVGLLIWRW